MKTKQGRRVTKKVWNLYEQMYKYRPDSDSKTTIKIVYGKEADEIKKAFDDVIDEHTDDYGMPKPVFNMFQGLNDYIPILTVPTDIEWLTARLEEIEACIHRHEQVEKDIPKDLVYDLLELAKILL